MDDIINKLTHDGQYATDVCLLLVLEDANESLHYLNYLNITGKELETLAHDCLPNFDIDYLKQTIRFLRSGFLSMDDVRKNLNSPKPVHFINRLIKKSSSKIEKMYLILFTSLIVIGSCVFKNQIISTINRFIKEGLNLSRRDVVWELAIGYYKKYPLFGAGIQSLFEIQQIRVPDSVGLGIFFCHNTFITILCVGGIVGFVCFLYHVFETFRATFELDKYNKCACLLFLMVGLLHGLVDNTFFSIEYLLPLIVVFSNVPRLNKIANKKFSK